MKYKYMVKDNLTGEYAGKNMVFSKRRGKVWTGLGYLKSAIKNSFSYRQNKEIPPNWEIICLVEGPGIRCNLVMNANLKEKDIVSMVVRQTIKDIDTDEPKEEKEE